jgi:hypothetical protein
MADRLANGARKIRKTIVLLLLTLALAALSFFTGCRFIEPKAYYGPPPVGPEEEANTKKEAVDGAAAPIPTRAATCEPASVYGPRPCGSDDDCVEEYGPDWYCNSGHTYDDGCGGTINWPICEPRK